MEKKSWDESIDDAYKAAERTSLSSFSYAAASDDEFDEIVLPLPQPSRVPKYNTSMASDTTPLVAPKNRKKWERINPSSMLFGHNNLGWQGTTTIDDDQIGQKTAAAHQTSPRGISGFFFGFMYEDPISDDNVHQVDTPEELSRPLKLALCLSFMFTSAAATTLVTLVPVMARNLLPQDDMMNPIDVSAFTSKATASAVLGLATGKFMNGPLGDILGARRVSITYAVLLSLALVFLSLCWSESSSIWACFFVEFFQSVQWPGIIVVLASHSRGNQLEAGIYAASLSSRLGSLLSIPLSSLLLRYYSWRVVSALASLAPLVGAAIVFVMVKDSPSRWHDPQNPISASTIQKFTSMMNEKPPVPKLLLTTIRTGCSVFRANLVPSLKVILRSMTFWIVAIAHAGDAMVGTSQRILGMYYFDTSGGTLSENKASGLAVVLSFGTIFGLAIAGHIFNASSPRGRKRLIGRLYTISICACYLLAVLAIPKVQQFIGDTGLTLAFQLISTFFMGFGGAVQTYIPGIIGAKFGKNKGLFSAYTDGIAYGLSSLVWKVVGGAVHGGDSMGWAYGWAAVALLVVICALMMVEFFENFFVRGSQNPHNRHHRGYETIIFV